MVVLAVLLVGFLVATVVLMIGLRSYVLEEGATEAQLRRPEAHALRYAVPGGQDPAIVMAALGRAGYRSVADFQGGIERVLIACEEEDRGNVRDIIEHVDRAGFDGPELHVGHVTFQDER